MSKIFRANSCIFGGGVASVSFLPEELSGADEGSGMLELPPNNIRPLIDHHRQVSMRVNPLSKRRVHNSLGRRSNRNRLSQLTLPRLSHPSHLRRESFQMLLFFLQRRLRHKHRKVDIVNSMCLDPRVNEPLDLLPNVVGVGPQDVAP